MEQTLHVRQLVHTAANGEGDVHLGGNACHHVGERLPALVARGDVEKHQLVGAGVTVGLAKFHGVACMAEVDEIAAFHRLSVFHVKAGDDALGQAAILQAQGVNVDAALVEGLAEHHGGDAAAMQLGNVGIARHAAAGYQVQVGVGAHHGAVEVERGALEHAVA